MKNGQIPFNGKLPNFQIFKLTNFQINHIPQNSYYTA